MSCHLLIYSFAFKSAFKQTNLFPNKLKLNMVSGIGQWCDQRAYNVAWNCVEGQQIPLTILSLATDHVKHLLTRLVNIEVSSIADTVSPIFF